MGNGLIFPAIRRDGSTFYADIMLNQLDIEDQLYGIAIVRDYTLQKNRKIKFVSNWSLKSVRLLPIT